MSAHPVNLAVRFLLELAALAAMGVWGFANGHGVTSYLFALAVPLTAAVFWGTFAVPNDPSRNGRAPIPVAGIWRLTLEFAFFGLAIWMLFDSLQPALALSMGAALIVHYAFSFDRIAWLLRRS